MSLHLKSVCDLAQNILLLQYLNPYVLISALVLASYLLLRGSFRGGNSRLPPGPPGLPFIGNYHQLGTLLHRSLHTLSNKYGPLLFMHLGYRPTIIISSQGVAQEIFKNHDMVFSNRPENTAARILFYGRKDIAFAPYSENWRQARKTCVRQLLSHKSVQSLDFVTEEEVSLLIKKIHKASLDGVSVNLSEMLLAVSNNISSRCVIGKTSEDKSGMNTFGELTRRILVQLMEFSFGDFFPYLGWLDVCTGWIELLKDAAGAMDTLLEHAIEEHKGISNGNEVNQEHQSRKENFMHALLMHKSDVHLGKDSLKDIYVGATDTTATLMQWIMAELIKNPTVMKKVQEEVRRVVGRKLQVEEKDMSNMKYLKCVIKEALRLHPPAPLITPRETMSKVTLCGGYEISSKTRVIISAWAIQRDPEIWDRAEEFIPERFENNPIDYKGQHFEFLPFGAGRRRCPGVNFAIKTVEYLLANVLYWFDWMLPEGHVLDMSESFGLTVAMKNPLALVPCSYSP